MTFPGYPTKRRKDFVTFSVLYDNMIEEIKSLLAISTTIDLHLGRIIDSGISVGPEISFFDVMIIDENTIKAKYYGDLLGYENEKLPQEKTIRFDNPLGDIPVLPGYEQMPKFFNFGEGLEFYETFIREIREALSNEIGNCIQLCYRNDDCSLSLIRGTIKEVNKGNILMEDYDECLVIDNKSASGPSIKLRLKNHRFISENGYLCEISRAFFDKTEKYLVDDGLAFGEQVTWNFFPIIKVLEPA